VTVDQGRRIKPVEQCRDVYDVLEQIRLRPSMWIGQGSLRELETMLLGYSVALRVHQVEEPFVFSTPGPFTEWLYERYDWSTSTGWAAAVERHADGQEPLTVFFQLLDEYRSIADQER
jgi:hypothetical protein